MSYNYHSHYMPVKYAYITVIWLFLIPGIWLQDKFPLWIWQPGVQWPDNPSTCSSSGTQQGWGSSFCWVPPTRNQTLCTDQVLYLQVRARFDSTVGLAYVKFCSCFAYLSRELQTLVLCSLYDDVQELTFRGDKIQNLIWIQEVGFFGRYHHYFF